MNRGSLLSFLFIFLITGSGYGQITTGGLPPSFLYETGLKSTIDKSVRIPVNFNTEDLKLVDEWKTGQGTPLRIATLIPTDLSIENAGEWSELPGGEKIWQLHLQAKDATAIMLYYNAFYIPEGGQLFIYNAGKTHVLGAYTHITNLQNGKFVTEFVAGDEIILEYVAAESGENPRIEIESIGYGYNHLTISLRSSGSCMVNINCDEGDAWQSEKRGVCRMIQRIGRNSYYCTGSLINNTAEDLSPYVLTAYHCMEDDLEIASDEDLTQWMFYFNYESNTCRGTETDTGNHILIGCTRKVAIPLQGGSDGLLLLLQNDIPESFDVYYNGWDRREVLPQFGVNMHHPQGDIKKISTFTQPATDYTWLESGGATGATSAHFNIIFSETVNGHGVTEGGSSGSPLFNENKLVVGTLTGGNSSCNYLNGLNVYGKFSFHWNKYGTDISQRMDVWLDPLNKGVETLNGMDQVRRKAAPDNLSVSYSQQQVVLQWKAPTVDESPSGYYIYRNHTFLDRTNATSYVDTDFEPGFHIYGVSALYSDGSESSVIQESVYIQEYKPPTDVTVINQGNDIEITWKAPVYEQTIFRGTQDFSWTYGFEDNTPFYFGQLWPAEEIKAVYKKQLTAVEFIPVTGSYEIYIVQGERDYRQTVTDPQRRTLNRVPLNTPFAIGSEDLIISVYAKEYNNMISFPAACDNGPEEDGKGTMVSLDGVDWRQTKEDINFIVAGVISSQEGELRSENMQLKSRSIIPAINKKSSKVSVETISFALKSQLVTAFPEVNGYNIYRNNNRINSSLITETSYVDKNVPEGKFTYQLTAVYSGEESPLSEQTDPVIVDILSIDRDETHIFPVVFKDQVSFVHPEFIKKVEIYQMEGQLINVVESPQSILQTGKWASGVYIFRIYTNQGIKIVKGIKK